MRDLGVTTDQGGLGYLQLAQGRGCAPGPAGLPLPVWRILAQPLGEASPYDLATVARRFTFLYRGYEFRVETWNRRMN